MFHSLVFLSVFCTISIAQYCPHIVSRTQWGSQYRCTQRLSMPVSWVIIHHTAGTSCASRSACSTQVKNIQTMHKKDKGWCDIGYNFLVGEDGNVYEGRGWTTLGSHAAPHNSKSIGISFIGDFTNRAPSMAAQNAAKDLIACGVAKKYINKDYVLKGHRDVKATICPGNVLYGIIQTWSPNNDRGGRGKDSANGRGDRGASETSLTGAREGDSTNGRDVWRKLLTSLTSGRGGDSTIGIGDWGASGTSLTGGFGGGSTISRGNRRESGTSLTGGLGGDSTISRSDRGSTGNSLTGGLGEDSTISRGDRGSSETSLTGGLGGDSTNGRGERRASRTSLTGGHRGDSTNSKDESGAARTSLTDCAGVIARAKWGSQYSCSQNLTTPVSAVVIHHTAGAFCSHRTSCSTQVKNIQTMHKKDNGWCDIGYNFLIGEDGKVYEGRGWTTLGAHAKSYNHRSIGISFIGNFTSRVPNLVAQKAAQKLIAYGVDNNYITKDYILKGHRDVASTACPGDAFYKVIKKWSRYGASG